MFGKDDRNFVNSLFQHGPATPDFDWKKWGIIGGAALIFIGLLVVFFIFLTAKWALALSLVLIGATTVCVCFLIDSRIGESKTTDRTVVAGFVVGGLGLVMALLFVLDAVLPSKTYYSTARTSNQPVTIQQEEAELPKTRPAPVPVEQPKPKTQAEVADSCRGTMFPGNLTELPAGYIRGITTWSCDCGYRHPVLIIEVPGVPRLDFVRHKVTRQLWSRVKLGDAIPVPPPEKPKEQPKPKPPPEDF